MQCLCRPEGCSPVEIVNACGSLAWQALRAQSGGDCAGLRSGSLGECGPGGAEERAQGSEIPQPVEQRQHGPMGWGLACSVCYSFSKSWCGKAFHELGVQSADVSALPYALPQSRMFPASQQSPWIMELTQSVAVSQSPSWILLRGGI
jgi:hypothetical protein